MRGGDPCGRPSPFKPYGLLGMRMMYLKVETLVVARHPLNTSYLKVFGLLWGPLWSPVNL